MRVRVRVCVCFVVMVMVTSRASTDQWRRGNLTVFVLSCSRTVCVGVCMGVCVGVCVCEPARGRVFGFFLKEEMVELTEFYEYPVDRCDVKDNVYLVF